MAQFPAINLIMKNKLNAKKRTSRLAQFLNDLGLLLKIPVPSKFEDLALPEYPFDSQALALSQLYRNSRKIYVDFGGKFSSKLCSVARSLSSQDLFMNCIDYSPMQSELLWFKAGGFCEVTDPQNEIEKFLDFNGVSLYHEQNHRIVWAILPPAPSDKIDFCRYLNFAESLVITLDLALADQIGKKLSPSFERLKTIYRTGGEDAWAHRSKQDYRSYLQANCAATYLLLELYNKNSISKGLNFIFPKHKRIVNSALKRSQDLSKNFVLATNQLWQERYWQSAQRRLAKLHQGSKQEVLYLPENPLDFGENEFAIANQIFSKFGL